MRTANPALNENTFLNVHDQAYGGQTMTIEGTVSKSGILLMLVGLVAEVTNMLTNVQSGFFLAGLIIYGHSSMDRALGYGLKFGDHFQHTHLGWIGKRSALEQDQAQ